MTPRALQSEGSLKSSCIFSVPTRPTSWPDTLRWSMDGSSMATPRPAGENEWKAWESPPCLPIRRAVIIGNEIADQDKCSRVRPFGRMGSETVDRLIFPRFVTSST